MAVSHDDVRHVAELARVGLDPSRLRELVAELNGILRHMDVLSAVDPAEYAGLDETRGAETPLRADGGEPASLLRPCDAFAPAMRDGFFLVPRLATHEGDEADATR